MADSTHAPVLHVQGHCDPPPLDQLPHFTGDRAHIEQLCAAARMAGAALVDVRGLDARAQVFAMHALFHEATARFARDRAVEQSDVVAVVIDAKALQVREGAQFVVAIAAQVRRRGLHLWIESDVGTLPRASKNDMKLTSCPICAVGQIVSAVTAGTIL